MLLKDIENIIENSKFLKSDIVCINGPKLIGLDSEFTIVKESNITPIPQKYPIALMVRQWQDLFKDLQKHNVKYENIKINEDSEYIQFGGKRYYHRSSYVLKEINRIMNQINMYTNLVPRRYGDISKLETFNKSFDKLFKTSNGAYIARIDGYCLSVYKSLIPFASKDSVNMYIYDSGDTSDKFMCKYEILKKKEQKIINEYILMRKL